MDHLPLRIFDYTDFRAFLKDALQALKDRDPKFSQDRKSTRLNSSH